MKWIYTDGNKYGIIYTKNKKEYYPNQKCLDVCPSM